jgi:hypothetical protein
MRSPRTQEDSCGTLVTKTSGDNAGDPPKFVPQLQHQ